MRTLSVISLLLLAILTACSPDNATAQNGNYSAQDITIAEFLTMDMSKYHLIDVRTPEEYKDGNVEGSININWYDDNFTKLMEELSKDKPTIIYCRSGGRSKSAMNKISGEHFPELYNVLGGYLEYSKTDQ
ncbi:MAG: phage shock protein E [Flavobacteriales bacterium]|jgi:phage shock protein E